MNRLSHHSRPLALFALMLLLFSQFAVVAHAGAADHKPSEVCETCASFDRLDVGATIIPSPAVAVCTQLSVWTQSSVAGAIQYRVSSAPRGPPIFQ